MKAFAVNIHIVENKERIQKITARVAALEQRMMITSNKQSSKSENKSDDKKQGDKLQQRKGENVGPRAKDIFLYRDFIQNGSGRQPVVKPKHDSFSTPTHQRIRTIFVLQSSPTYMSSLSIIKNAFYYEPIRRTN